ncbi:hypothetical protein Thimo_2897 [Thioflavicoccus mobilis 8321]|uniref:Uncharacterized protein n=1 Tax=Thioflavicoccus mobilis 8321 TaxID=765912 RepID=L0H1Y4_9GAMM|nr:hypothetical protein Thimo_2897 [Thioflavicoccus mobilis 8321]
MNNGQQRQRHGVHKHLAEGVGGVLVGAAVVLLLRGLFRKPDPRAPAAAPTSDPPSSAPATR